MKKKTIIEIISILYMCLMLYAAISKWMDYNLSREQMALMPLLTPVAHVIIWLIPSIEITIAILLYLPRFKLIGLYAATAIMFLFTFYVAYMMLFYKNLPCSCGGLLNALSWKGHLIFNSIFIILGIIAVALSKRNVINMTESRTYSIS